ncbi:chitin binding Peritrophin-A domain protein [Teladorsagia circumcincta]|uniref:Chitin binding Peritrophin-A domain protein n=1 Tax=Teladorsagia circumcincta TaxID=45464 RepID=A0A2G9V1A2_TELCI|nr:chitin binding Peritrophin-A domain protein [Teladorsagia circumcincta]
MSKRTCLLGGSKDVGRWNLELLWKLLFINPLSEDMCAGRSDGPLNSTDCRPSFSFCVSGALYSTTCPGGLLYSFVSRRCEWASECGNVIAHSEPTKDTTAAHVYSVVDSRRTYATASPARPASDSVKVYPSTPRTYTTALPTRPAGDSVMVHPSTPRTYTTAPPARQASDSVKVYQSTSSANQLSESASFDCSTRANGKYSLGGCVERFVMCSEGRAYVRGCPAGLVYNEAKGLCDYDCSDSGVGSSASDAVGRYDVKQSESSRVQSSASYSHSSSSATHTRSSSSASAAPVEAECVTSVAMGRCSSKFWRCRNGKLESAQCPGQSLFDETFLLCVYDLPECKTEAGVTTAFPEEVTTTTVMPVVSTDAVYTSSEVYSAPSSGYQASAAHPQQYSMHYPPYGGAMNNPFGMFYPPVLPFGFQDVMHGRDKVNHGPIDFESRSALTGGSRVPVRDIFDGIVSPWLLPGIDRVFVPRRHDRRRDRDHLFDDLRGPQGIDISPLLETTTEGTVSVAAFNDGMLLENAVPHEDGEHPQDKKDLHEAELEKLEGVPSQSPVDSPSLIETTTFYDIEGSGDEEVTRKRRSYSNSANFSSTCTSSKSPGLISIGFCRQDFIFCKSVGNGVMAACPVGDLFDSGSNKCVTSDTCGLPEQAPEPVPVEPIPVLAPASTAESQRYFPGPTAPGTIPSVPISSPADAAPTSTTTRRPPVIYPPMPAPEADAGYVPQLFGPAHGLPTSTTTKRPPVIYPPALEHDTGHVPQQQPSVPAPVFAADIVHQAKQTGCVDGSDYAVDCNGNFMKCVHGIAYPMKCPAGLVFDQTKHYCDYPAAVVGCGGVQMDHTRPDHALNVPTDKTYPGEPILPSTTQAPMSEAPEFDCAKPLVFNPDTLSCDFREFVAECEQLKGQNAEATPTRYDAAAPTVASSDTSVATSTTAAPLSCVYSDERPAFALDYCSRVYGMCTVHGVLERKECSVGFLFDSHLSTCVPSEECGQEHLKELISKATYAPPEAAAQVSKDTTKHASRKDDRCHNSLEGAMKPMGRCRSSYIRCMGGEAVVESCATTAEVFSSAVGACVLRINAPECRSAPQRTPQSYTSASSSDPAQFCRTRTDGLYRNPSDCTAILQCFGGDVFEYPSCSSGLVFNELTAKCDYRDAVPECRQAADEGNVEHGCRGASHGDLVANESDCQQFYRCVWDRLESMRCPSGTVFNPKLSVCDWPDNVPQCSAQQHDSVTKAY